MANVNNSYITYGESYPITLQINANSPNFNINGDTIKIVTATGDEPTNSVTNITIRNSRGGILGQPNRTNNIFTDQQSGVVGYIWDTVADQAPIDDYVFEFTVVIDYNGKLIKLIDTSIRKSIKYNSLLTGGGE